VTRSLTLTSRTLPHGGTFKRWPTAGAPSYSACMVSRRYGDKR